jgi:hypothetical protein
MILRSSACNSTSSPSSRVVSSASALGMRTYRLLPQH